MGSNRNIDILEKVLKYCNEIEEANQSFGGTLEALKENSIYKNAVAMCILQIGELTTHLTDDFKALYDQMPWKEIKGMRNIAAHNYGSFDLSILHSTICDRIPELKEYCAMVVAQHNILEQEIQPPEAPEMEM
jgi:Uncharacterized conserved protein